MKIRFLALLLVPLLAGCAGIRPENMVTNGAAVATPHSASVAVSVEGGSPGVQWYSGTVTPEEYEKALRSSIENSKVFSQLTDKATADYLLSVNLTYAGSHPGFYMNAWVHATWTLTDRAANKSIWTKDVESEGGAGMGDEFIGAERQYRALERAVKANIESGLADVGNLQLKR